MAYSSIKVLNTIYEAIEWLKKCVASDVCSFSEPASGFYRKCSVRMEGPLPTQQEGHCQKKVTRRIVGAQEILIRWLFKQRP